MKGVCIQLLLLAAAFAAAAAEKEVCIYRTPDGKMQQVNSRMDVPIALREEAKCFSEKVNVQLSRPDEIELEGAVREVTMSSAVGRIQLRWPRKIEMLFGRTPERAMAEAAYTVSRTLKQSGFPPELRALNLEWNVVFMDENMPETQIPSYLVMNCHPGWMTPPANIYIVGQRVVRGCSSQNVSRRVGDGRLAQVVLHEMGHVVEYQLLEGIFSSDRMRAEGFASWFEQYAAGYSTVIPRGMVEQEYRELAKRAVAEQSAGFQGTPEDYARASLFFQAVVSRRGVRGLMDVYQTMKQKHLSLVPAIMDTMHWSERKLGEELGRVLKEGD